MQGIFAIIVAALQAALVKPDPVKVSLSAGHQVVAVRDGYRLVELPPGQGEQPRQMHAFADIPSLAAWAKRNLVADTTQVFARAPKDQDAGLVVAISGATWDRSRVTCTLDLDPVFRRLLAATDQQRSQDQLLDLLRALLPRLGESGARMISSLAALELKANASFSRVVDPKTGTLKARVNQANVDHNLPAEVTYEGPIYLRGATVKFTLALQINFDNPNKPPGLALIWPEKDTALLDAFFAEIEALKGLLGDDWSVSLGSLGIEDYRPSEGFEQLKVPPQGMPR